MSSVRNLGRSDENNYYNYSILNIYLYYSTLFTVHIIQLIVVIGGVIAGQATTGSLSLWDLVELLLLSSHRLYRSASRDAVGGACVKYYGLTTHFPHFPLHTWA